MDLIKCAQCRYLFSYEEDSMYYPRKLDCNHRLCGNCYDQLSEKVYEYRGQEYLVCPVCFRLAAPRSEQLCHFMGYFARKMETLVHCCCFCNRDVASLKCVKCDDEMCVTCGKGHQQHTLTAIPVVVVDSICCPDHQDAITFYCKDHKQSVCARSKQAEHTLCDCLDADGVKKATTEIATQYCDLLQDMNCLLIEASKTDALEASQEVLMNERIISAELEISGLAGEGEEVLQEFKTSLRRKIIRTVRKLCIAKMKEIEFALELLKVCQDNTRGIILQRLLDELIEPTLQNLGIMPQRDLANDGLKAFDHREVATAILDHMTEEIVQRQYVRFCEDTRVSSGTSPPPPIVLPVSDYLETYEANSDEVYFLGTLTA